MQKNAEKVAKFLESPEGQPWLTSKNAVLPKKIAGDEQKVNAKMLSLCTSEGTLKPKSIDEVRAFLSEVDRLTMYVWSGHKLNNRMRHTWLAIEAKALKSAMLRYKRRADGDSQKATANDTVLDVEEETDEESEEEEKEEEEEEEPEEEEEAAGSKSKI